MQRRTRGAEDTQGGRDSSPARDVRPRHLRKIADRFLDRRVLQSLKSCRVDEDDEPHGGPGVLQPPLRSREGAARRRRRRIC